MHSMSVINPHRRLKIIKNCFNFNYKTKSLEYYNKIESVTPVIDSTL